MLVTRRTEGGSTIDMTSLNRLPGLTAMRSLPNGWALFSLVRGCHQVRLAFTRPLRWLTGPGTPCRHVEASELTVTNEIQSRWLCQSKGREEGFVIAAPEIDKARATMEHTPQTILEHHDNGQRMSI